MYKRLLLVIWKWIDLQDEFIPFGLNLVQGDNDALASINENYCNTNIDKLLEEIFSQNSSGPDKILILCHQNWVSIEFIKNLLLKYKYHAKVGLIYFQGGQEHIYYSHENDTGLLDQNGYLQDDDTMENGFKSVFIDGKIKFVNFDNAWNHYYYSLKNYKPPIYTHLRENLLLETFGTSLNQSIREWIQQLPKHIQDELNEFIDGDHPLFTEKGQKDQIPKLLQDARQDLLNIIDTPNPELKDIRTITENLMNSIPGPIF